MKEEMKAKLESTQKEVKVIWEMIRVQWSRDNSHAGGLSPWTITERQKVPNEEAAVEMIRALEDRSGDWHLAIRHRGQLTHCAVSAWNNGLSHTGPTAKKWRQKGPGCNNNIRNQHLRQHLHTGSKKAFNRSVRETLRLEVVNQVVKTSIGLYKMSDWTLWRGRHPPKWEKRRHNHSKWKR
jgi:hypothetical protein